MEELALRTSGGGERYSGIDFFRGLAVLFIFWNHFLLIIQESGALKQFPIRIHYGVSDSAAVFVFLSGVVSGIAYFRRLKRKGFLAAQKRSLRRAGQIYLGHFLTLVSLLVFTAFVPARLTHDPLHNHFQVFFQNPVGEMLGFLSLRAFPSYLDILPFYFCMMPLVPFLTKALRARPSIVFGVSLLLYAAMQAVNGLGWGVPASYWFVNPFAWQFLFILGIFLGTRHESGTLRIPRSRGLAVVAGIVVLYFFANLEWLQASLHGRGVIGEIHNFIFRTPPWTEKKLLEPFVLIHFLSVAYIVWFFGGRLSGFFRGTIARHVIAVGQNSLTVFCIATVLGYCFSDILSFNGSRPWGFVGLGMLGWVLLVGVGMFLSKRTAERAAPVAVLSPGLADAEP